MGLREFGTKLGGYWQLLVAGGAIVGILARFSSLPAQVTTLQSQHTEQIELLREGNERLRHIECGVTYTTYKDKLDCIERGH
jgi:hypothetical protein